MEILYSFVQHSSKMFVFNILFVLFCATSIRGETEVCATSDSVCLTERINEHMAEIADGSEGEWAPLDPMTKDVIETATDKLTATFTNVVVTGFKNCKKNDLTFIDSKDAENSGTFSYYLNCDELLGEGDYTLKGVIGDLEVEGEGHATATLSGYEMSFYGTYTTYLDDNEKTHLSLTYDTPTIANGKPQYTWTDLACGDAEKTQEIQDKLNNEQVTALNSEITAGHLVVIFTDVYEPTCNDYLKARSYEEIFSYEKC